MHSMIYLALILLAISFIMDWYGNKKGEYYGHWKHASTIIFILSLLIALGAFVAWVLR